MLILIYYKPKCIDLITEHNIAFLLVQRLRIDPSTQDVEFLNVKEDLAYSQSDVVCVVINVIL